MRRLGIMGGTFDPIHLGHLVCAEVARDACGLDEVLFVVAGSPHFKQGMTHAAPQERLAMVELAVEGDEAFFASDLEVMREGITYTAETLDELTRIPMRISPSSSARIRCSRFVGGRMQSASPPLRASPASCDQAMRWIKVCWMSLPRWAFASPS